MASEFALNAVRYEDVRAGIVNFLKDNNPDAGNFDFAGSNIGYQIDVAAYVTMLLSYQNTLISNNFFIDTTELRKNAVSIAKTMGYRPKLRRSARFSGTMEYFADSAAGEVFQQGDTVTIPARTKFVSSPNGFNFINHNPITLTFENTVQLSVSFIVEEGVFRVVNAFGDGIKLQKFIIDSTKVEENHINVSIRKTNTDRSNNIMWSQASTFFSGTDSEIFFVEEDIKNEKKPLILFGDGILGKIPQTTETIEIEYVESKGSEGNAETGITFVTPPTVSVTNQSGFTYVFANLNIVIPSLQVSFGGEDNETLTEVQFNAPRFFSTGGRGVTAEDLISLISIGIAGQDFTASLKYFNVIGGPELFPNDSTELGITYITAVPGGINEDNFIGNSKIYLSEVEENEILPTLVSKTVVSTIRRFLKPTYVVLNLDPFIEVPTNITADEKQNIITNSLTNIKKFNTDNLRGLGKDYRHSQAIASLTNTAGVVSAEMDASHNFAVTHDSFYDSRISRKNLPILFKRDVNGNVIFDADGNPTTTNFIKKRKDIIIDENKTRLTGNAFTQLTLPISLSSFFGSLSHINSLRSMFNIDIAKEDFITFELIGPTGQKVLTFDSFPFKDQNNITYVPNLIENGLDVWNIQLNGRTVGTLNRDSDGVTFTITAIDTTFLSKSTTLAVVPENVGDDLLKVALVTETDENNVATTFYKITLFLTNELFTDVRLSGVNKIADAQFDASTFKWTFSNLKAFKDETTEGTVTLSSLDPNAIDENFLQITHIDSTSNVILSMKHFNGTFSLNNFVSGVLAQYTHRNDLKLTTNFTVVQDSSNINYEISSLSSRDASNVQTAILKAKEQSEVKVVGNSNDVLDGTWFSLNSAKDATQFYVWFASTSSGLGVDPAPSGLTRLKVTIANNDTATQVAAKLQLVLNDSAVPDFIAALKSGDITTVVITNTADGKSIDTADSTVSGEQTGFTFTTIVHGADNLTADITEIKLDELIDITGMPNTNNNGKFLVKSVNSTLGTIDYFNVNGLVDATGVGTIKHFLISSGTYGSFKIDGFDVFDNISIGTLNYETGELVYKQTIKGFTDLANNKILLRNIKSVFNNYTFTGAPKMDTIKMVPIENFTNTGLSLGQTNDFDEAFNISIQANITTPIIKQ